MEMEFKQYFKRDFKNFLKSEKTLQDQYSGDALPSIDFKVGESKMENIFGEAIGLAFEYSGIPAYN